MIPVSYDKSDLKFGIYAKFRVIWVGSGICGPSYGLVWVFMPIRVRNSGPDRLTLPTNIQHEPPNSAQKYPDRPKSTLYDPEFWVDSDFDVRFGVAHQNLELQTQLGQTALIRSVKVPVRFDQADPKIELTINF